MMRGALFLFSALNETDIGWMARAGAIRRFAAGDPLIRAGETIDQLLVLLDGVVRVETAVGRAVAIRREGECLGEVSLVDTLPASSSVFAVEPVRALQLSGDRLRAKIEADSGFASRLWHGIAILLANRLREATSGGEVPPLDDIMLDAVARSGDRFLLLLDYTRDSAA
jgi:CRP/FNR family cyclic AMP-dependent transcriptional regulator